MGRRRAGVSLLLSAIAGVTLLGAMGNRLFAGDGPDGGPLLEDVQPARLKPNRFQLALPITNFLVFQGDFVSIPIKLAVGRGQPQEVALSMEVLFRSGQTGPFLAGPFGHDEQPGVQSNHQTPVRWVNGYSVGVMAGPERLAPHIARLNFDLPVTKYLRLRVHDKCPADVFALRITGLNKRTGQKVERVVKVAVHVGFEFAPPQITVQGQQLRVQFRDVQGNVAAPETAILRGTSMNGSTTLVLEQSEGPEEGVFVANIGELNPQQLNWRLFALRRGFVLFDKPVQVQAN